MMLSHGGTPVRRAWITSDTATVAQQARKAVVNAAMSVGQFGDGHKLICSQKLTAVVKLTVLSYLGPGKERSRRLVLAFR